ncbi:3-ketoacyl-CoA synthase 19 [Linum perenne]
METLTLTLTLATLYILLFLYLIFTSFISPLYKRRRFQTCYMLDYECYKPPSDRKLDAITCGKIIGRNKILGVEEMRFLLRAASRSGMSDETYGPRSVVLGREASPCLEDAYAEVDEMAYATIDGLLEKTGVLASEVDVLVTTVSLISPSPSWTSRIVNRYKMREDVKTYNLSGMGCSGSVTGIDLVQQLMKSCKNSIAIVVSTECMGQNWYTGKDKSMMLSNILFRAGACSMLFTNNPSLSTRSILKLKCLHRTHIGENDDAYRCCIEQEDEFGRKGFHLGRNLTKVAGEALTLNLRVLLPRVLPTWEILRYLVVSGWNRSQTRLNLKSGIDHFCIHPGGRAVIDTVGESLWLDQYDIQPAKMGLFRFGNTSSAGLWYVLGYMEAKKRLKKGDVVLMISLGAGFKCNNSVWVVTKDLVRPNVWEDCINDYPPTTLENSFTKKLGHLLD